MEYIYLIAQDDSYKIGRSANPRARLSALQTGHHKKLSLLDTIEVNDSIKAEKFLHGYLGEYRLSGEWFNLPSPDLWIDAVSNLPNYPSESPKSEIDKKPQISKWFSKYWPGEYQSEIWGCSLQEKGAWMDMMSLFSRQNPIGVIRYSIKELKRVTGIPTRILKSLRERDLLIGADIGENFNGFSYIPNHSGIYGDPISLVPAGEGPIFLCSKMVIDHHRQNTSIKNGKKGGNPKLGRSALDESLDRTQRELDELDLLSE